MHTFLIQLSICVNERVKWKIAYGPVPKNQFVRTRGEGRLHTVLFQQSICGNIRVKGQNAFGLVPIINLWERESERADCIMSCFKNQFVGTRGWEGRLHTVLFK